MVGTLQPGQTKVLTVAFTDNANPPVAHPLSALPTCVDPSGVLTISPTDTLATQPAVTDPTFAWSVLCPATVAESVIGTNIPLTISATNPDGTVDTTTFTVTIAAADDTVVTVKSFV